MQARFGEDFTDVQIHRDCVAAETAAAIGANAFTFGRHIVFGAGRCSPRTNTGRGLLAHELAHIVQQARGGAMVTSGGLEANAAQAATAAIHGGGSAEVSAGVSGVGIAAEDDAFAAARKKELQRAMLAGLLALPATPPARGTPASAPGPQPGAGETGRRPAGGCLDRGWAGRGGPAA